MEEPNYGTFSRGKLNDVFIKWPEDQNEQRNETKDNNNEYMVGYVWPSGKTVFPDFLKKDTQEWWIQEIQMYYWDTLKFDG